MTSIVRDSNKNPYSLSIRFSSDGFSLYVFDENKVQLSERNVVLETIPETKDGLIDVLSGVDELTLNFSSVRLIFESELYSVIPLAVYSEQDELALFNFHHNGVKSSECILKNELLAWDAVLLFSVPAVIQSVFSDVLPEVKIEHHIYTFISDFVALENDSNMHIWLRPNFLDVVVIKNGNLQLINSFKYKTNEDFIYFVLNIYDKLFLDREHCKLSIHNAKKRNDLIELVSKYISHCKCID